MVARFRDEGRDAELAAMGDHAEPIPDWVHFLNMAEGLSCPPWAMFDDDETPPPKAWWRQARTLLDTARAEARRQQDAMRKK